MAGPPQLAPFDVVEEQLIINKLIIIINFKLSLHKLTHIV